MDDRTRPDTNVVLLRRKGDPCEAERERVARTIFAEPDDVATFSRGNLVPPPPDARDANDELAASGDPFFDRVQAASRTDEAQRTDLADDRESTDAYFDRLTTQSPAEMSMSGAPIRADAPMPGSAQLPEDLVRASRHRGRLRGPLIASALTAGLWSPLRRSRRAWRLSAATLGVLAALVAGIAVVGESGAPGSDRHQSQRDAGARSLEPLTPGVLAASASPFAGMALGHRSATRARRPDPSNSGRPRSHRAGTRDSAPVRTIVKHRVVVATYTPARSTSASVGGTSDTQGGSGTGSTPPAAPTHTSSSGSRSSSGSASPSKATLRSLVTGAGTCSCQ